MSAGGQSTPEKPETLEEQIKRLCACFIVGEVRQAVLKAIGGEENIGKKILDGVIADLLSKTTVKVVKPSSKVIKQAIQGRLFASATPKKRTPKVAKAADTAKNGEGVGVKK